MTATAACMIFSRDGGGVVSSVDVSIISAPELKFKTQMGTTDLLRSPRPDSCFPFSFSSSQMKEEEKEKDEKASFGTYFFEKEFIQLFFSLSVIVHF